ncbi:polyketide cyclase/dehydrase and lipid transporter [Colletotrichum eremochloae]|uniref:Putative polyketide cyclase/dehydrase and lipid transporter n=1 Tax=Colletotrichum sublineola TaxID=1173701 RepID=A0A066X9Q5_COLSU|nr:polyketide cyclase/dehydrase and lipid transporter [Colletotrichum sublineola]KAK2009395.1 polyketide cyclase/dehydrase and lipid transporter [Colletotrichum eremochloae]KDN62481.1 putative polyketide cyclase/dehydrase and lipid transporter [Colletotrichum sublineola]
MSTVRPLLRLPPPLRAFRRTPTALTRPPLRRPFFNLPNLSSATEPQTLTACRTMPYHSTQLYDVISDVDAYDSFVPYCAQSRVTQWTAPDASGRRWPAQADLRVGWGGFEETFTSRLHCVPGKSVEAVSGADVEGASPGNGGEGGAVFRSLVTKWQLRPLTSGTGTEVDLVIRFQFANPLYSAVSAAVSEKVAGVMIQAFEKRVKAVLGIPRL